MFRKFRLFTRGTRYRGAVLLSSVALRRICQRMTNARDMELSMPVHFRPTSSSSRQRNVTATARSSLSR